MFKKILVANRGEIACRVLQAAREMNIPTLAVYSEADQNALHVLKADEAALLGPPAPGESYLNIDKIIEVAKEHGADAIHPGYGFLSENHRFAKRCEDEGITFIGSHSESIRSMGNKIEARQMMIESGVPVIPGMSGSASDVDLFKSEADKVGYPVLLKAAAGGGGKGMRVVHDPDNIEDALNGAMREAKSAFGDDSVYLEKYIEEPRHVEFQIMADKHGNCVYLFERECSIQRRHQKIIEETPSVAVDDELRRKMGEAAVRVAKACEYSNAGTVEFLLDKKKNFYFLEMNTRIQVEHPVTEMVVGVDLVKEQIRVASGEKLSFSQEELFQHGHAIECRIYAEDAENNFLPSSGKLLFYKEPQGPFIRVDSGVYSGVDITVFYDPILAKLIVWGERRNEAVERMKQALDDYIVLGVKTSIHYLKAILEHPEFISGKTFTDFIPRNMSEWEPPVVSEDQIKVALLSAVIHEMKKKPAVTEGGKEEMPSPWNSIGKWEIGMGG
ncbi:MAG: acetyl-CoA carboxylase biotin carboxylase subunit [candidate division Zixibacteria bacterium]|nr:acetyl-CoA carboxylase biotin carboxylase subunit [candidate division Zixibacteria bacterium]